MNRTCKLWIVAAVVLMLIVSASAETVKVGLNYPKTGPYSAMGLAQWQAAELAVSEINASGGINGNQIEIIWRDSKSDAKITPQNVNELIDEGAKMIFGGSASSVAVAAGNTCQERGIPFFATLSYSTATTGTDGHRCTFRECYDSWMGAKAIADYLNKNFAGKKYLYITADYTWGHTTESSVRKFTNTEDTNTHKGMLTPFPKATEEDFKKAISFAKMVKPDVLVLVLFGNDMVMGIRQATTQGLKSQMQIVVPNLTLGMAEGGGPKVMEGVIGALPWCWQVPYKYNYERGKQFVETFAAKYNRYPSTSGASAYAILYEYKAAVERAGSFDTAAVVKALEGHEYQLLKDKQQWRDFDHQSVQTVYAVKCKPEAEVLKDKFKLDYFEIINEVPGAQAVCTRDEWNAERSAAGKPTELEPLPTNVAGSGSPQQQ
ncbi:MAG: substrate-binding protein [Sedimentisphaerales bacterium]|nr:substrate-binding protein [Sedimentisphaerales bacterium]